MDGRMYKCAKLQLMMKKAFQRTMETYKEAHRRMFQGKWVKFKRPVAGRALANALRGKGDTPDVE